MEAACLRRVVTGRRNGKRAQLDQGQYGIDSGSCNEVKRLSYDVVEEQRVLRLRPSCLESYAVGMGTRSEHIAHSGRGIERAKRRTHFGHGIQRKKGLSLQPPESAAGKGLNHSTLAAVPSWATIGRARLNPSGLSRAKGRTPRFLGRETLEKPDNDLSITPHFAVYKGFGA